MSVAAFIASQRTEHGVPHAVACRALEVSQDRIVEKDFLTEIGLRTAPYARIDDFDDLRAALGTIGPRAILKTRRFGYDGKGQAVLRTPADAEAAWQRLGGRPVRRGAEADGGRRFQLGDFL